MSVDAVNMDASGTALILAGGKSSRFGRDKAFIDFNGKPMVQHVISRLRSCFGNIIISANVPEKFRAFGCPVCTDIFVGAGPSGGIHAGLLTAESEWVFITACDMPYISIPIINQMKDHINKEYAYRPLVIAMTLNGFIEPFHAFYSRDIIPDLEIAVSKGLGISGVIRSIPHHTIECIDKRVFFNINSPEDYSALLACNE